MIEPLCVGFATRFVTAARRMPLLVWTEAVGKSRGGVSLVPDLVGDANVGATAARRASRRDGSEAVVVEL